MSFKVAPRETVTKCTVYDNKFRSYPEEARLKVIRAEKARIDAQESEPARYERLLMAKMLKGDYFVQKEKGQAVAALSKMFAMIFLFPPFFMFFQLPKWTFQIAIPKMYEGVDGVATVVMIRLKRISAWTGDVFGTTILKAAKKILARIPKVKIPFKTNLKTFKEFIQSKIENVFKPFEKLKVIPTFIKKMVDKVAAPIKSKIEAIRPYYKALTDGVENWVSKLQIKMDEFTNYFKPLPPPIRAYGQKDPVPAWKEKLIEITEGIKAVARDALKVIMNPVEFLQTKIEPFVNWVYPMFPFMQEQGVNMARYTSRKVAEAIERVQEYARIVTEKTTEIIIKIAVATYARVEAFVTYYSQPFIRFGRRVQTRVSNVQKRIKSRISKVKESFARGYNQFQEQSLKVIQYVIKKIKKVPEVMKAVAKSAVNVAFHLYKALQTLFIFFKVTIKIAFQYLMDRANSLLRV